MSQITAGQKKKIKELKPNTYKTDGAMVCRIKKKPNQ